MPYEYGYHGLLFPYSVNVQTIFASSQICLGNGIIPQYGMRGKIISVICGSFCGISQIAILCIDCISSGKSIASLGRSFTVTDTKSSPEGGCGDKK
ncbi:hypothetical protein ES703_113778 [subsurface metagenome]